MFFTALHLRFNAVFAQLAFDAVEYLADHFASVTAGGAYGFGQHAEAVGEEMAEGQVLHLLVDAVQAQAVGNRCVDFQGFTRDTLAFFRMHGIQSAHIVQAVGELDQHHAHVARHRQQHFAEVFRLRLFLGVELDAVEFGYAVDQFGHRTAELFGDLVLGDLGVFDDVVQQRRGQRL